MTGIFRALGALLFHSEQTEDRHRGGGSEEPMQPSPSCTVLVIDDDPTFLEVIRPVLKEAGFNVLTSKTGPKGLDMLRYAPREIAAVLLDYSMPGFNGAQTVQFVRTLNPAVRVIGITGLAPEQLPADYRQGVDALVLKPFKAAELIATLRKVVGSPAAQPVS
jgi:two-component system cell cycle sensor histidine kinase/response regulator CckA